MAQIAGPQFQNMSDYDCIVSAVFPDVDNFVRMKADPYFKEKVMPDHENFADTKRSRYVACAWPPNQYSRLNICSMSIGWIEDHIRDGRPIE